jgi:hypothetical protein
VGNDRKGATAAGFGGEGQSGGFQGGGAVRAKLDILRWPLLQALGGTQHAVRSFIHR